jgi:hypothetical protein
MVSDSGTGDSAGYGTHGHASRDGRRIYMGLGLGLTGNAGGGIHGNWLAVCRRNRDAGNGGPGNWLDFCRRRRDADGGWNLARSGSLGRSGLERRRRSRGVGRCHGLPWGGGRQGRSGLLGHR